MSHFLYKSLCCILLAYKTISSALACSSCGCSLTSDWVNAGLTAQPGLKLDLRYDYVPQTDLRSGGNRLDHTAITFPNDQEIQRKTYNHYITLGADYSPNQTWGFNIQVQFSHHPHTTIAPGDSDISASRSGGLGDIRAIGRFQGFGGSGITGISFGVKLPTGSFRDVFKSGPQAGGALDRGLQAGSGTVDVLLGAYHFGQLAGHYDYFIQGQGQIPLNSRRQYRAGVAGTASIGMNYTGWGAIKPQLQINTHIAAKDSGLESDRDNSGGTQIYLSPGASLRLSDQLTLFSFVQLPLYQYVAGYQLTPKWTLSVGLQSRL